MRKLFVLALTLVALSPLVGHATEPAATTPAAAIQGTGKINKVDAAAGVVNMRHEPIPALKWRAMTMDFKVTDKKLLAKLKPGQAVNFSLVKIESGEYLISSIEPVQ